MLESFGDRAHGPVVRMVRNRRGVEVPCEVCRIWQALDSRADRQLLRLDFLRLECLRDGLDAESGDDHAVALLWDPVIESRVDLCVSGESDFAELFKDSIEGSEVLRVADSEYIFEEDEFDGVLLLQCFDDL